MKDNSKSFGEIKKKIKKFNDDRGWHTDNDPKNLSESLIIEAAELLELFQWLDVKESSKKSFTDKEMRQRISEELADVFIYGFDIALALDLDIAEIIEMKMTMNAKKHPIKK